MNKVQISCDIERLFGQLVILYYKQKLRFFTRFFSRLMRNEKKKLAEEELIGL